MNKQDVLAALLKGEPIEASCVRDGKFLEWANTYMPLNSPSSFQTQGRYLNHFCVGSDPEFALMGQDGRRVEATSIGLRVGLAAGCDQNERLVELRPWPSVSVVEHVAGILTELRWLYRVYHKYAVAFDWRAGAWFANDGMGGHVHFGRKRPTRKEEVAALDGLARVFRETGMFPVREWDRRMAGDALGQHYGTPGDFRVQKHGYEYRSLPSWLQSPTVAFIAVAASKLAVLDPSITTTWKQGLTPTAARNLLRGLAKLYRGRDDDAYILYHLLTQHGDNVFEVAYDADFARAWGITRGPLSSAAEDAKVILPACIQPTPEEVREMQEHLLMDCPLSFKCVEPNFVHSLPDKGQYIWVPSGVSPLRRSGFGDLLHNLVVHKRSNIEWNYTNHDQLHFSGFLPALWHPHEVSLLHKFFPHVFINKWADDRHNTTIIVPKCLCQAQTITGLRTILLKTGLFPLWTVDTVDNESYDKWLAQRPEPKTVSSWRVL